jgi:hypothetical protein
MRLFEDRNCFVNLHEELGMILPWVAACAWIGNATCIPYDGAIFIADDKATVLFLNEVQNINDSTMPLPYELLLTLLGSIQEH